MKKIYNIILGLALISTFGCEPLGDTYDELDATDPGLVLDFDYTLTEDDYELVDNSFPNFGGEDEAKEKVPTIMAANFGHLGNGSSAVVTYDVYNGSSPYFGSGSEVTVSEADYDALGYSYGNFDDLDEDLPIFAAYKMPDASTGAYIDVTHNYYNGSYTEDDVVNRVVKTSAYGWMYVWNLPGDSYKDFFQEPFSNFSDSDEAEAKIPTYLPEAFRFAEEGTSILVGYIYYDGGVVEDLAHFTLVDGEWVIYGDAFQVSPQSLSFGLIDGVWVPDNTIKVQLGFTAYQAIGGATATSNPAGSESILAYSNFDISLWSSAQIFDAITAYLKDTYPNSEEGQKYLVTYDTWEPGNGTADLYVILEGGEYVLFEQ
ncbi:MAG: hypothetical protein ABJG41_09645 [Cyclobacteriaceae bacterium]